MNPTPSLKQSQCPVSGLSYFEGPINGPPLILLHGVARNHTDWYPVIEPLAESWHLILVDHLGHGLSQRADSFGQDAGVKTSAGKYTVKHYSDTLASWFNHRSIEGAVVLGHSLGAMTALALAAQFPHRIIGAILEDPPFESMGTRIGDGPYQQQFAGMQHVTAMQSITIEQRAVALGLIEVPTAQGLQPLRQLRDRVSLLYSAECLASVDPEVFTPLVESRWLERVHPSQWWKGCECPVLGLQGDPQAGGTWTSEDVEDAQRLCSRLHVITYPKVGHQIHRTATLAFLADVARFRELLS